MLDFVQFNDVAFTFNLVGTLCLCEFGRKCPTNSNFSNDTKGPLTIQPLPSSMMALTGAHHNTREVVACTPLL